MKKLVSRMESFAFGPSMGFSFNDSVIGLDTVTLGEVSFSDSAELLNVQGEASKGNSFVLGTLKFKALSPGTTSFNFVFDFLTDLDANHISGTLAGADVTIPRSDGHPSSAVSEPDTWTSAAIGTLLLATRQIRRLGGVDYSRLTAMCRPKAQISDLVAK